MAQNMGRFMALKCTTFIGSTEVKSLASVAILRMVPAEPSYLLWDALHQPFHLALIRHDPGSQPWLRSASLAFRSEERANTSKLVKWLLDLYRRIYSKTERKVCLQKGIIIIRIYCYYISDIISDKLCVIGVTIKPPIYSSEIYKKLHFIMALDKFCLHCVCWYHTISYRGMEHWQYTTDDEVIYLSYSKINSASKRLFFIMGGDNTNRV